MNKRATEKYLNAEQFEQLQAMYINTIVDSMSMEDLQAYVTDNMEDFCNNLTNKQLIQEIEYTLDGDMLDEMITTIMEDL
mgnify:CR=1 FL=1|tara:strand:- start:77 stop:316 length:240 start_codon:yes stop_codon:yes gene_type:complete